MKLYEFQGKRIFKEHGIPSPQGKLLTSPDHPAAINPPAVLKAQVLVGGRGKSGGIKIWEKAEDLPRLLGGLFAMKIKGEAVRAILLEEKVEILHEFYISITYRGTTATPILVVCAAGGVEIEKMAQESPENMLFFPLDPFIGLTEFHIRRVAKLFHYQDYQELKKLIKGLYEIFKSCEATLIEINPLASTPDGLIALDAKVILDNKSSFRHQELFSLLMSEQKQLAGGEDRDKEDIPGTITYIPLSGSIGLISDGAGTGMLTLDLIKDEGGEAANFCEMGGITNPGVMYDAMTQVLKNPKVRSLLVVLIGGFNRMDDMAEGILRYLNDCQVDIPLTVRMCGTLEEVGKEMMVKAGIPVEDDLLKVVKRAVSLARR